MSYNRRMFGGWPGGPTGPRHNVNPWEGGVVPGQPRPAQTGIPGVAPQPMNLLSTLSTQGAQLALASNLLSSLLGQQLQQQQMQPPAPRQMLTMNSSMTRHPGFLPYPDGMNAGGRGPMRNRGGHASSRFPDMYKNQQGQRGPRLHTPQFKRGGTGGGTRQQRGKMQSHDSNKDSSIKGKTDERKNKVKKNDVKEEDQSTDADQEESEKKSKDDNDGGEGKEEDDAEEEKEEDEKNKKDDLVTDMDGSALGAAHKGREPKPDQSRYKDIPKELLVCHICNKNMRDGQSFENHLRGKIHQIMMDQTEKSYRVQVKLMREGLKLAEEKREIELKRGQRLGKKVNLKSREYCTMCDLFFFGNLMGHRKNQLHQNLKKFMHPRCKLCSQEFPSRTEWDNHQLSPVHLLKLSKQRKKEETSASEKGVLVEGKKLSDEEGDTGGSEDLADEGDGSTAAEAGEGDADGCGSGAGEEGETEGADAAPEESPPSTADPPSPTAAAIRRTPGGRVSVPPYDPKKVYGVQLLKKVLGYTCDVCNRFFFQHKEALAHCQTVAHYKNYMTYLVRNTPGVKKEKEEGESEKKRLKTEGNDSGEHSETPAPTPVDGTAQSLVDGAVPASLNDTAPASVDSAAPTNAQEHSADSTTESEAVVGGEAVEGKATASAAAAASDASAPAVLKTDENGAEEGDTPSDTAQAEDFAEDSGEMEKADSEVDDAAEEKDDKKSVTSSPNRRGVRRGVGRGRGQRRR